ncbi:UNVERIFIED_CONTAM: hypothetical protein Sindi_0720200 [Sesamum indicum]
MYTAGDGGETPDDKEDGGEDADSRSVAGDGGEEDEQPLYFEEGEESDIRYLIILDVDATIPTVKEVYLAGETTRFEAPLNLGFFEKKRTLEDETSGFNKPACDGVFPENKGGNDFMETRGSFLNEKDGILATGKSCFRAPPFLGFSSSSTFNGGRGIVVSREDFNMSEFLNLANRVVDTGDASAMEALAKLKTRWEEKFGLVGNLRMRSSLYFGRTTIKPHQCILEPVTGKMRREGSNAMVTFGIPPVEKLQATETEMSSDSGDKLARSGGEDGCPGGVSTSDLALVAGKQAEGMNQYAAVTGLGFSPKIQISPESGHILTTNSRPLTYADLESASNDVENVVDSVADVGRVADVMHDVSDDVMDDVPADVIDDVAADAMHDVAADVTSDAAIMYDKIANAFNNSSWRTLSYITPTIQNGEVVVRPMMETIHNGSTKWKSTVVGYFLGKRPYFYHVKDFAFSVWPGLREVKARMNGFFFFQFKTVAYMEEATDGGPWLFQGQLIVLQKWETGMAMRKLKHIQVPIWIKLRHLPVELWTNQGLSIVASGIGKPLYPDTITKACTRLDFAHVRVMLNVTSVAKTCNHHDTR